ALSGDYPATAAVLYRRFAVERAGGWDETLKAAQDRDFFTSVVLSGAKVVYRPGCCYTRRHYGALTVASSNLARSVESHCTPLQKAERALARAGRFYDKSQRALAFGYFEIAHGTVYTFDKSVRCYPYMRMLDKLVSKIWSLDPNFHAADETPLFRVLERLF